MDDNPGEESIKLNLVRGSRGLQHRIVSKQNWFYNPACYYTLAANLQILCSGLLCNTEVIRTDLLYFEVVSDPETEVTEDEEGDDLTARLPTK